MSEPLPNPPYNGGSTNGFGTNEVFGDQQWGPFPSPGFVGGGAIVWPNSIFVSPLGNDAASGSPGNPKATLYAGLLALNAIGGGTCYVANDTLIGGPVADQGIRYRTDFQIGDFGAAHGFVPLSFPTRIVGMGNGGGGSGVGSGPFTAPGPAVVRGGGDKRSNPPIWVVGSNAMPGLTIENLQWFDQLETGPRIGVDYDWDPTTLDVVNIPITSATRTGTATTYTLALPTGFQVTHASRTSNITTLTIPNPGVPHPPWRAPFAASSAWSLNVPIRFTSGAPGTFPSTDAYLSAASNPLTNNTVWTISYSDPGPDVASTPITGTVQSHGCCPAEFLELTSNNGNFLGTLYEVTATTVTTVTVDDTNNQTGDQGATPNIGTMAHTERLVGGTTNVRCPGISFQLDNASSSAGPGWDLGHVHAWRPEISGGLMTGFVGTPEVLPPFRNEFRMAACFSYSGTGPGNAAGFYIHDGMGAGGSIVGLTNVNTVAAFDAQRMIFESGGSTTGFPLLQVEGNDLETTVYALQLANADNPSHVSVVLHNVQPTAAQISDCGIVDGPCIGGNSFEFEPGVWISSSNQLPPWAFEQVSTWADGRITGKHPAAVRGGGVYQARFPNFIPKSSAWSLGSHTTLTTGLPGPFETNTAEQLAASSQDFTILQSATTGDTWTAGGKFYICGWINLLTPTSVIQPTLFRLDAVGVVWEESGSDVVSIPNPYMGTGWQFVSMFVHVASVSTTTPTVVVRALVQTGGAIQTYGLNAAYIPTTIDDNDAYEYLGTLKPQPTYLAPGKTGTMDGETLTGHGGLVVGDPTIDTAAISINSSPSAPVVPGGANFANIRWNAGTGHIEYCKPGGAWTTLV